MPAFGRSFANLHRLAHRLQLSDRSSATRASAELRLVLWRNVLCQFGRSCENTSLASPLDARTSARSRLRCFNAASTHSSSAAPAVLAPTEMFTCQVVGSSLVSSSMGFRYCHGGFCWDFRIVKFCVCKRGSAIARCFGRHRCSPALEAPLIARMAAHTLSNLDPSQQPFEDLEQSCQAFWWARAEATSAYVKVWALDGKVHPHHKWRLLL